MYGKGRSVQSVLNSCIGCRRTAGDLQIRRGELWALQTMGNDLTGIASTRVSGCKNQARPPAGEQAIRGSAEFLSRHDLAMVTPPNMATYRPEKLAPPTSSQSALHGGLIRSERGVLDPRSNELGFDPLSSWLMASSFPCFSAAMADLEFLSPETELSCTIWGFCASVVETRRCARSTRSYALLGAGLGFLSGRWLLPLSEITLCS
jgi:hypothetical protein